MLNLFVAVAFLTVLIGERGAAVRSGGHTVPKAMVPADWPKLTVRAQRECRAAPTISPHAVTTGPGLAAHVIPSPSKLATCRHSPDAVALLSGVTPIARAATVRAAVPVARTVALATRLPTYPDLAGLPRRVDLSHWDMPPGDQGFVGSCAAWATTYALAGWYANHDNVPGAPFAPMASYHTYLGSAGDTGSLMVAHLIIGMAGLIPMGFYSQGNYDYASPLTATERRIMRFYRIASWYAVYLPGYVDTHSGRWVAGPDVRQAIESSLAHGVPVALGLPFFIAMDEVDASHSYIGAAAGRTRTEGFHAVFASRYDEHGLWIENDWGLNWGLGGYAELSWDFVKTYVDEALAITGLNVARGAPVPAVTAGPPRLTVSGVLHRGGEVTINGRGFRPHDVVVLFRDGASAGRWPVTPWGTVQTQVYFHPTAPEGPHNHHWSAGRHTLAARSRTGDRAAATLTVAGQG